MAGMRAFERELKIATAGLEDEQIRKLLAQTAREALAEAQAAGEFPEQYIISVNGRIGGGEDTVVPPGPIVYTANWWQEILTYAMEFARQRSPVRSGDYKNAWFVMVNGTAVADFNAIPLTAECTLTNDMPYARKIEIGKMKMSVPPGVVEDTISAMRRRFGDLIRARRMFINLEGAYRLRHSSVVHHRHRAVQAGRTLTYPAAVLTLRL